MSALLLYNDTMITGSVDNPLTRAHRRDIKKQSLITLFAYQNITPKTTGIILASLHISGGCDACFLTLTGPPTENLISGVKLGLKAIKSDVGTIIAGYISCVYGCVSHPASSHQSSELHPLLRRENFATTK